MCCLLRGQVVTTRRCPDLLQSARGRALLQDPASGCSTRRNCGARCCSSVPYRRVLPWNLHGVYCTCLSSSIVLSYCSLPVFVPYCRTPPLQNRNDEDVEDDVAPFPHALFMCIWSMPKLARKGALPKTATLCHYLPNPMAKCSNQPMRHS